MSAQVEDVPPAPPDDEDDEPRPDDDDEDLTAAVASEQAEWQDAPPAVMSEQEMDKAIRQLEREADRHGKRVREIMGDEAGVLIACELCDPVIPGYRWPVEVEYDQQQRVLAAIGVTGAAALEQDDEARQCDRCKGHGETLTGSLVLSQRTRPCARCGAKGWTTQQDREEWDALLRARAAVVAPVSPVYSTGAAPSELPAFDAWRRPLGHEFYGRNPVYMTAADRARDVEGAV